MAPPFLETTMPGAIHEYLPPCPPPFHYAPTQQQLMRKRHDSTICAPQMALRPAGPPQNLGEAASSNPTYYPVLADTAAHQISAERSHTGISKSTPITKKQGSFHFSVTTNPTQNRDRAEMREIRQHVMRDFLRKERKKSAGNRDIRAAGPKRGEKRRKTEPDHKEASKTQNLAATSNILDMGVLTPQSSCDGAASSLPGESENESTALTIGSRTASQTPQGLPLSLTHMPHSIPEVEDDDEGPISDTENLFSILGFKVSPYHSWLQSMQPSVDLEKLKYDCKRRLRARNMTVEWLPTLIRARHSFLSDICISAAHDEAMQRIVFGSDSLRREKRAVVYERLAVKSEVHGMINACLDDPKQRLSDETIIAVMNILNSEIISCDWRALEIHQRGINKMVMMRGGLSGLGVHGLLARTLTVTMMVNAILQEKVVDEMYSLHAHMQATPPPRDGTTFPESPVYCGEVFTDLGKVFEPESETMTLMNLMRDLTFEFMANKTPSSKAIWSIQQEIEKERRNGQAPPRDRRSEAIQLTAALYTNALANNIPFSRASGTSHRAENSSQKEPATFVAIVRALRNTDLDKCWGELNGILFWIVLVAGAAAAQAGIKELDEVVDLVSEHEEEEARRWLAAVAVRCSIILGFEHGTAVLGILGNVLDIQARLSHERDEERRRKNPKPDRRFGRQDGFDDFAWEFHDAEK